MKNILLAALLFLTAGLTVQGDDTRAAGRTLRSNQRFPAQEIERLCEPSVWRKLRDLEYTGYVIMEGRLDDGGHVKIRKTIEKNPDDSRSPQAVGYGNKVFFNGANSASRIPQRATVYVIFYENLHGGENLAVIFGKQTGGSSETNVGGTYLNTVTY